jgi:hypothetical protein
MIRVECTETTQHIQCVYSATAPDVVDTNALGTHCLTTFTRVFGSAPCPTEFVLFRQS